jgi:ribulose-5-phosphate 4-epimerase/fuculose-1-phosphate aldolase
MSAPEFESRTPRATNLATVDMERLRRLRERALAAPISRSPKGGLVTLSWGNASAIDRELGRVAIKPSGVGYADLPADDIVVLNVDGEVLAGRADPRPIRRLISLHIAPFLASAESYTLARPGS